MQLTIDTHTETPRALRVYSEILQTLAKLATDEIADASGPQQQLDWQRGNVTPAPHNGILGAAAFTVPPPPPVPSNVVPFAQQTPAAPSATSLLPVSTPSIAQSPVLPPATAPMPAPNAAAVAGAVDSPSTAVVGCDSTGLPWDERIHSSGANKLNSDGTWRQKRGVNPMLVSSVTAELRARPTMPVAPAPVSLPLPVPPPPPVLPVSVSALPPVDNIPPVALPPNATPTTGTVPTFTQLFAAANRHGLDNDRLTALVVKAGGTGLESLVNNPAMIAIVYEMVQESVRA